MIDLNSQPDSAQPKQIIQSDLSSSIQMEKIMDALKDVKANKVSLTAPLPSSKNPLFVDTLLEE